MKAVLAAYNEVLTTVLPSSARRYLSFYSISLGLLAILDAAALGLLAAVISPLVSGTSLTLPVIGKIEGTTLFLMLGLVCLLIILKGVFSLLLTWFASRRFAKYELTIGNQLLDAYLSSSWLERLKRNSSDLIRIADSGIAGTNIGFMLPIATLPGEALTFLTVVIVLAIAQPLIALISLVYLGLIGLILFFWISRRAREAGRVVLRSSLRVSRLITEMVAALKEITLRNKTEEVAEVIRSQRVHTARARANIQFLGNVPRFVLDAALVGGFALVGTAGFLIGGESEAVIAISLFALAGFRMAPSLQRFQAISTQVLTNLPIAQTVIKDIRESRSLERETELRESSDLEEHPTALSFNSVAFRYSADGEPAVEDVSLTIPFGSTVAIVGSSGAGKSTMIDLILGLIEPTSGSITIDGTPISEVTRSWRSRVGYVPQEVSLFDGTVAQNVALSWTHEFDRDLVVSALTQAQLMPTIETRMGGIDGRIGERGLALSGGQRQRLGIARALYSQPLVLVLDEATSALDTATEAAVSDAIKALRGKVTTVTVAHRLATIKHADQIFFMSDGRVVSHGTFAELVAAVPEFANQAALAGLADTLGTGAAE